MLSLEEVSKHNDASSCWVIVNSNVYDVTEFLPAHPGGANIILKYAGKDATLVYEPIHPPDALEKNLDASKHLGQLNADAIQSVRTAQESRKKTDDELRSEQEWKQRPPLSRMLGLTDIEEVAKKVLSYKAYAYYSSASDDEMTNAENIRAFARFFFNARIMRPVSEVDLSTTILGHKTSLPIFVSASGLAKLGHPLGEVNIVRGCASSNIIQMVSSNASCSYEEIAKEAKPGQNLFFQLYKNSDNAVAAKRVQEVERLGYKAIFLTVDAVVSSNRTRDVKAPWELEDKESGRLRYYVEGRESVEDTVIAGTSGNLVAMDDQNMTWETTIPWLRSITKLPIVVKGIQCVEDAVLAAEAGIDGILLSNHGGRQLEYSLPPMEVLYQIRQQRPDVFNKLEVYIDGGIRRGTDVLKALCLGATAVGMGRPFLYAQSAYGEQGVQKLISIFARELRTGMKLMGAASVTDLTPDRVQRVDWQPLERARL